MYTASFLLVKGTCNYKSSLLSSEESATSETNYFCLRVDFDSVFAWASAYEEMLESKSISEAESTLRSSFILDVVCTSCTSFLLSLLWIDLLICYL